MKSGFYWTKGQDGPVVMWYGRHPMDDDADLPMQWWSVGDEIPSPHMEVIAGPLEPPK